MSAYEGIADVTLRRHSFGCVSISNNDGSLLGGVEILLRLAGVNPNSEAIRIISSTCRFAIGDVRRLDRIAGGDFTMAPYFPMASVASTQRAKAPQ